MFKCLECGLEFVDYKFNAKAKCESCSKTKVQNTTSKAPHDPSGRENHSKTCNHCHIEKTFNEFYPTSKYEDGVSKWCKSCLDIPRDKPKESSSSKMKKCPKCNKNRRKSSFKVNSKRPDGLTKWCKDCLVRG